ncbi:MAG TPA: HmuY family protein [Flavobacterium sp.]|nr:HmuY family protein [Flavobacterium sp.]
MMKFTKITAILVLFLLAVGCEKEETFDQEPFVVAFAEQSIDYSTISDSKNIDLVFSEPATDEGSVTIEINPSNAEYGVDFKTTPEANNLQFELSFNPGDKQLSFVFQNLVFPFDREDKNIEFRISSIQYNGQTSIQGYANCLISFDTSLGGIQEPNIGGPNEPNVVFMDLSTGTATEVQRDTWDLSFYSGEETRVAINGSIYMAAGIIDETDLNAVNSQTVADYKLEVTIGTFEESNVEFIDAPNGHINETAIAEISANDADNKVYLINMGYEVGTNQPPVGTVEVVGNSRGWKKIRILKKEQGYLLQYADLDDTSFEEVEITKNPEYNFVHYSMITHQQVEVEPKKTAWDIAFSVFTNINEGAGSYGFSDFVYNNLKAGVKVYALEGNEDLNYQNFHLNNVDESLFENDQRVIGASWRDVITGEMFDTMYYILKDLDGNYYKIKMLGFKNDEGERGHPKFEYKLLN